MGLFYLATPVGSALGYIVGGYLGHHYGWRAPFMISALPGLLLAFGVLALREPVRGASDHVADSVERGTVLGLFRNKAYWTHHPGRGHDDLRHRRTAGLDAHLSDPRPARAARPRQYRLRRHDRDRRHGGHFVWWLARRSPLAAHPRGLSTDFGGRDGAFDSGDRIGHLQPRAGHVSGDFPGRVLSSGQHRSPECGPGELGQRPHSRHRSRGKHIHHSPAGRRFFAHADWLHLGPKQSGDGADVDGRSPWLSRRWCCCTECVSPRGCRRNNWQRKSRNHEPTVNLLRQY